MQYLYGLVLLFATLKEIWLILNQGKLDAYAEIATKPDNERTKEERDIVISIGLITAVTLAVLLATLAALVGLLTDPVYTLPASLALGLTVVKFGVVQLIPRIAKPAYMICNSITLLILYGCIIRIMFFPA